MIIEKDKLITWIKCIHTNHNLLIDKNFDFLSIQIHKDINSCLNNILNNLLHVKFTLFNENRI